MRSRTVAPCDVCGCPATRWLSVGQVALQFKCSDKSVRRLIKRGEIDAVRFGRQWRIDHESFDEYVRKDLVRLSASSEGRAG